MFACQIQTKPALHCAQQFDLRLLAKNFLNEIEIGKIVFDIKNGALAGSKVLIRRKFIIIDFWRFDRGRFGPGKINPKSAPASNRAAGAYTASHRMHDAGRESKAEASSLYRGLFRPEAVKRCK